MSRPAKRAKLDNNLHPLQSSAPKLLARLTKPSLCALALTWLIEQHPNSCSGAEESEEESGEEEEGQRDLSSVYCGMRDDATVTKSKVVARIGRDWRQGFTYRQIAQLDVQYLLDKPNSKSWTAYQLIHDGPSPMYATPAQLLTRLRTALSPYFNHHLHLHTAPTLTLLRLQLLPTTPSSTLPSALSVLALPSTPYLLFPSLPTHLAPILLQCFTTASCTPPAKECRELDLKGRNWEGVREMLIGRQSAGGMAKWRGGKGEGGGPLVPVGRRVERDDFKPTPTPGAPLVVLEEGSLQATREKEVGEVWGREELPVLERLDYEIHLPYPSSSSTTQQTPQLQPHPPFLLRLEGSHVLSGLRAAVAAGFTDGSGEGSGTAEDFRQKGGLPEWIGGVMGEGRNLVVVGKTGEGEGRE